MVAPESENIWIFGYGSLVWRPAFDSVQARPAVVKGWRRMFWQGSTDHRGVPAAPGRVVTLVPDEKSICWGMAYEVHQSRKDEVLETLDHRERGGYERELVPLHFPDEPKFAPDALFYIATPENPNYLGHAPIDEIAAQVIRSRGPSGHNRDYVLELAYALRAMAAEDNHVFELAEAVRKLTR